MSESPARTRPLVLGLIVLAGVLMLVTATISFANAVPGNLDDAFITLVYARHLFEHHALYWNLQDGHTDGFTSLLHVLIEAATIGFTNDPLAMARDLSLWTHLAGGIACLAVLSGTGPQPGSVKAILAASLGGLALSLHPAPAHGASFLLESPIFVLLAIAGAALPLRFDLATQAAARRVWIAVLVLLCLVRPEGQALAVLLSGIHAGVSARAATGRRRWAPLLGVGLTLLGYYSWHLLYFAALFPNTYYAKSSASRWLEIVDGWAYLRGFAASAGLLGWITLALPGLVTLPLVMNDLSWRSGEGSASGSGVTPAPETAWSSTGARARHLSVAVPALASLLMVIWEGGDSYDGGRFLAVPAALSLVACVHLATSGPTLARRGAWVVLVTLTSLAGVHQLGAFARGTASSSISASMDDYVCERRAAATLAEIAPDAEVMQTDWQRLEFFEDGLRVIDLHGLNDREIARIPFAGPVRYGKFSHAHALEVGAPVWVYGHRLASDVPMAAAPMAQLLRSPPVYEYFVGYAAPETDAEAIAAAYVPASVPVCGRYFNFLVRREHAESLARQGVLVGDGEGRVRPSP